MGVYIKNMSVPLNCYECPMCLFRRCCADGIDLTEKMARPNAPFRPDFCPLVEVIVPKYDEQNGGK